MGKNQFPEDLASRQKMTMIKLTRLNGSEIVINSELIEHVELTADTVVTLTNGTSFVVKESSEQIVEKVIEFKRQVVGTTWALKADRQMA